MKEKIWRYIFLIMAMISGGWLAVYGAVQLMAKRVLSGEAASIGIIGGADGPTAIFVTTSGPDWDLICMAALLVIGVAGYWWLKHRKPKE